MAATVNQLIAAAKKQATIAAKIERRARWLAPYDADRLAGGITALDVPRIAGGAVIDPMAEVKAAVYASGMGLIARVGEQSRQMIASVAKRPVAYDLKAAMQAVINPMVLDVMEASRQAGLRALQMQIPLAVQILADSAAPPINGFLNNINVNMGLTLADSGIATQIKGLLDMRLTLAPDWAGLLDGARQMLGAIAEYWKEGTFIGDVLRVAYEGERYTEIEAEQALDRLIDKVFTLGAVTGGGSGQAWPKELKPYVKPLIRQAIQESATRDLDLGKLRTWLLRRVCRLWAGKSCEMLMILHDFGVQRPGQVLTLPPVASAPALEGGGGLAPKRNGKGGRPRLRVLDEHQVGHARSYLSRIKRGQDKESSAQCEGHDVDTLEKWVKLLPQNPENTE